MRYIIYVIHFIINISHAIMFNNIQIVRAGFQNTLLVVQTVFTVCIVKY